MKTTHDLRHGVSVNRGDWIHVAIVLDDSDNSAVTYVNGEKAHEAALSMPSFLAKTGTLDLKIGSDYRYEADGRASMAFQGEIADLRVWSTSRTAEEIKANYNVFLSSDESGLLGNWKLDRMIDGVYVDTSAYRNDAYGFNPGAFSWQPADFPEGDYRIAVIPDTQYMARLAPDSLKGYFEWMKNNDVNWYSVKYDHFYRERNQFTMTLNLYPDDIDGGSPQPQPQPQPPSSSPTPPRSSSIVWRTAVE